MTEPVYSTADEASAQLQISSSTLRRWTSEFSAFLSESAGAGGTQRRYTGEDMAALTQVKTLLSEGLTYIQVGKRLEAERLRPPPDERGAPPVMALAPSLRDASPVASVLADTLHTMADGQQLLLNSQQANRDMLQVLLRDNFGLKEENARLRDRMLDLERNLADLRRQEAAQREALEARVDRVETQPGAANPRRQPAGRAGCLGLLLGLGR